MNEFEKFLKENNYEDDLEFQLCDLEMAFNAGKELQWKPSDEQINTLEQWLKDNQYKGDARYCYPIFDSLYQDLKKLREE